jgi:hypothetical protein
VKQYKIFEHPNTRIEAVKQGWSWPAFFFSVYWAIAKKMWLLGIGTLLGTFAGVFCLGFIMTIVGLGERSIDGLAKLVGIAIKLIFGANGNKWRENNLHSRGYTMKGTVAAKNQEEAVDLYSKQELTMRLDYTH